jgi:hypothetical protein
MKTIVFLLLFINVFNLQSQTVLETHSRSTNKFGIPGTEWFFDVTVNNIPTREVRVTGYLQTVSKGTVILTSGGKGTSYYSAIYGNESKRMIDSLHSEGLEVFEIKYVDSLGWAQHCNGIGGYHKAVEIYSVMVNYLYHNKINNNNIMMATGNSGGSFQIAYGLTDYGLDSLLDMVIFTGGPPVSDLKTGVFGNSSEPETWPYLPGGLGLTDHLMGWSTQQYCLNRTAPDSIKDLLDSVSLVSSIAGRDYNYSCITNFVQSDDPTHADKQAQLFYDTIQSTKYWHYLPNVNIHAVPSSIEGALKITEIILNYCTQIPTKINQPNKSAINIFPNPVINEFSINYTGQIEKLTVLTVTGKELLNINSNNIVNGKIDVSNLPQGVYILSLNFKNGDRTSQKMLKYSD